MRVDDFLLFGSAFFVLMFLASAVPKLARPSKFRQTVAAYRLVPSACLTPFSRLLPLLELGVPMLFATGLFFAASLLAVSLTSLFTLVIFATILRGHHVEDCGCLGVLRQPVSWRLVVRNAGVLMLGTAVTFGYSSAPFERFYPHPERVAELPQILVVSLAALLLFLGSGQLIDLVQSLLARRQSWEGTHG
jgi:hypothetical protein